MSTSPLNIIYMYFFLFACLFVLFSLYQSKHMESMTDLTCNAEPALQLFFFSSVTGIAEQQFC